MYPSKQGKYLPIFTEWYFSDPETRVPQSQHDWCKANNVGINTITRWVKKIKENQRNPKQDEFEEFMVYLKTVAMGGRGTSRDRELFMKANGWLVEKREDTVKVEFTVSDRQRIAGELITSLKEEYRKLGICSVCGFSVSLCSEPLLDSKSKYSDDNTVATVGVPD